MLRSQWGRHLSVPQQTRRCAEQGSNELVSVLGGGRELALFLGPLRLLLFFRRHGWFLFIFPLIFDLFRHGMCSQDLRGVLWMQATLAPTATGRQSAAVT